MIRIVRVVKAVASRLTMVLDELAIFRDKRPTAIFGIVLEELHIMRVYLYMPLITK